MAQQEQVRRQAPKQEETIESAKPQSDDDHRQAETEALLDEIDGLLEENAEEFVKGYQQKGGQ